MGIFEVNMVKIPIIEYKRLLEASARVQIFSAFVNSEKYITQEECRKFLGIEVPDNEV